MTPERKEEIRRKVEDWLEGGKSCGMGCGRCVEMHRAAHELLVALEKAEKDLTDTEKAFIDWRQDYHQMRQENILAREVVGAVRENAGATHFQLDYPEIVDALQRFDEGTKP